MQALLGCSTLLPLPNLKILMPRLHYHDLHGLVRHHCKAQEHWPFPVLKDFTVSGAVLKYLTIQLMKVLLESMGCHICLWNAFCIQSQVLIPNKLMELRFGKPCANHQICSLFKQSSGLLVMGTFVTSQTPNAFLCPSRAIYIKSSHLWKEVIC